MERTFTYRNGCLFFVALWFSSLGLIFSLTALKASLSGHAMTVTSKDGTIITTGPLAWLPVFMPAIAVPIGLWLFLFAMNSKVVVGDEGVTIYNWAKRVIFKAKWREIKAVYRAYDIRGGYNLAIETDAHKEMVTSSLIGLQDLEDALGEKLGRVDAPRSELGLPLNVSR